MAEKVDILLPTYEGAHYLEAQLESIFHQTHSQFHLWVRDDASTDHTHSILQQWAKAYSQKMTLLPSSGRLGVKGNISELMKVGQAPYIMFADQDDVWSPNKIEVSLNEIQLMEKKYGADSPLVVHTDLKVVDQHLKEISLSFYRYMALNPHRTSFNRLLLQNTLTGCTMLMNRNLLHLAHSIPEEAVLHDWWIALVASCFGHIHFLNQSTMLYRQHTHNHTGAKRYRFFKRKSHKMTPHGQATTFSNRYRHLLSMDQQQIINAFLTLKALPYFKRKFQLIKHRFFKHGLLRNIKLFLIDY